MGSRNELPSQSPRVRDEHTPARPTPNTLMAGRAAKWWAPERLTLPGAGLIRKERTRRIAAYICLGVGVAGLVLPLLPGIPLLILGVSLLGPTNPIRRLLARWNSRRARKSS
jgi:hypothetical protein